MAENKENIFITLEGIDGCGKSTQAKKISEWLEKRTGKRTVRTAEPYILREFILGGKNFCALSDLLLFLADRAEHVNKIILPELRSGHNVICERYNESTSAYQSGGHALEASHVKEIINACKFPEPDIKIFLDINPETAFSRVKERNNINDKFEAEGLLLMKKVADFYRKMNLTRICCDNLNENEVFEAVISKLEAVFNERNSN